MIRKTCLRGRASAIVLAVLFSLAGAAVHANVSLKNGNFFIGYTDIVYPGGFEPKIERVYNSKTGYSGIFGPGWGTEYEVFLSVSADGSVVAFEYGGGAENRFIPREFSVKELDAAVGQISGVAKAAGILPSEQKVQQYRARLKSDAVFRNDEWQRFISQGKLKARQLKTGTQLFSNRFSFQFVEKLKEGYRRVFDNGRAELFDERGKLTKIFDKNNNFIKFSYSKDGKIQKLEDNSFRKMFFVFNQQGMVEKIEGENGKVSQYKYNKSGELVMSKDVGGNTYTYRYTDDSRHNLLEIGYADGTKMQIAYHGREQNENVKSIRDRDGTQTEYNYVNAAGDKELLKVAVAVKDKSGKVISNSSYDYYTRVRSSGEKWTARMIANIDGDVTDTEYGEAHGLPVVIKKGKEVTQFKYDNKGHVTFKDTPSETTKLEYHPSFGKVVRVDKLSKATREKEWSQFNYDPKGNLKLAKNSEKKGVSLFYDRFGRIARMVDQNKREIQFKYNENSKPIEIKDPKLGTIKVEYAQTGEVKKVDSSSGRRIALEVTSAFQNLLDIIRPAGVTLAF